MNVRDLARKAGVVVCLVTVVVLAAPYALIEGHGDLLVAYYSSGATGAGGVALFALLAAVVFASVERGNVDPGTLAGVLVVLAATTALLAVAWGLSVDPTVMYSFPAEYRWLEWHPYSVMAASLLVALSAAVYARELLG